MKNTYTAWYRLSGQLFWRKVKNVIGDGIQWAYDDSKPESTGAIVFRYLTLEDDTIFHLPIDTAIRFSGYRATIIERNMSKEAGQPVQRL